MHLNFIQFFLKLKEYLAIKLRATLKNFEFHFEIFNFNNISQYS